MVKDFVSLSPEQRLEWITGLQEAKYRLSQIEDWVFNRGVINYADMDNLPRGLRDKLALQDVPILAERVVAEKSEGGATKLAVELADSQVIECVILRYKHGHTLCVSTQAGCKMGCAFCATARVGFARNLTRHEMLAQLLLANSHLSARHQRITHLVLMGMGEPLDNYDESMAFIRTAIAPQIAISARRISVSTCGLVPGIDRLAAEGLPLTLSVSVNAADDELRKRLMPVARLYPVNTLLAAMHRYRDTTKRRVTIEYVLIKGLNDRERHARELVQKIKGSDFHVNLIPYNAVGGNELQAPLVAAIHTFQDILTREGISVTVRREMGTAIVGGCGQLRGELRKE